MKLLSLAIITLLVFTAKIPADTENMNEFTSVEYVDVKKYTWLQIFFLSFRYTLKNMSWRNFSDIYVNASVLELASVNF